MTPILGILASGISGNLWAPGKDYDSIATVTVGASPVADITFSSIPSTYRHLQLRGIVRSNRAGTANDQFRMTFNSDSGTNYSSHLLSGNGSAANAYAEVNGTYIYTNAVPASTATASVFGIVVMDILDYADTNKNKTVRSLSGLDANGSGGVELGSGLWRNTTAINTLKVVAIGSLVQYTQFALYGVK
jgi:hypothetical protein